MQFKASSHLSRLSAGGSFSGSSGDDDDEEEEEEDSRKDKICAGGCPCTCATEIKSEKREQACWNAGLVATTDALDFWFEDDDCSSPAASSCSS
jgi:hypothetical protein